MVQTAQHRDSVHPPSERQSRDAALRTIGDPLLHALVGPRRIEVGHVFLQHAPQVGLAEYQHMVQALPPDAPEEPLAQRVLLGGAEGGAQFLMPLASATRVKA